MNYVQGARHEGRRGAEAAWVARAQMKGIGRQGRGRDGEGG